MANRRLYSASFADFHRQILNSEIFPRLICAFEAEEGYTPPQSEVNAWTSSLPRFANVLRLANLSTDGWICIEQAITLVR
jgi:hypothetical protein